MMTAQKAKVALRRLASKERAVGAARFFKTAKGEYGYGDHFIGVTVPDIRKIARSFVELSLPAITPLIESSIHEERLLALFILVLRFGKADAKEKSTICAYYLAHLQYVNNWDLVDSSAPQILGEFLVLYPEKRSILMRLARSGDLWSRRTAVVASFAFIRRRSSEELFALAVLLLEDKEDLIHKALGWMLREVGKRISLDEERIFLDAYVHRLPRTALRYALEHFSSAERDQYMHKRAP